MSSTARYHGAACKTCRRKGKKCSRELPTCQSCEKRGNVCEGYALKWSGLASRGFLAGQDNPKRRPRRPVTTSDDSNQVTTSVSLQDSTGSGSVSLSEIHDYDTVLLQQFSSADNFDAEIWSPSVFQLPELVDIDDQEVDSVQTPVNVSLTPFAAQTSFESPLRPSLNLFDIPSNLSFILDYHLKEVAAKLCVDNNALANPYRQYIYPLALQKPALLYACAAMSSVHYSTCQNNESFFVEALRLRGKALSRLQESMWSSNAALDEGNLATILMMILCDMCMGGHSNFEMYFTLAKNLMDSRGSLRTKDNFVEQYISWLDVMSAASTSRRPVFSSRDVVQFRDASSTWSHDVVPCAADVFDILQEISTLHKHRQTIINLDDQIESLKARLLLSTPRTDRGLPWFHLTEAYRHASLLYMLVLFKRDTDEDEVNWLVSSIIQHSKSTPERTGWSDQLLWPLFHAGLKITNVRLQQWLRDMFRAMQSSGGFRNVSSALEALEKVWTGQYTGGYTDILVQDGIGDMLVI